MYSSALVTRTNTWRLDDIADLEATAWATDAACAGIGADVWFADVQSSSDRRLLQRICADCPVIQQCLDHALEHDEYGWWGGMSRRQRRRMQNLARAS